MMSKWLSSVLQTPPAAASSWMAVLLLVGWSGVPSDFTCGLL